MPAAGETQSQSLPQKRSISEDAASQSPGGPDPNGNESSSSKKRKTTAGGSSSSRGVANLTPEQLAKKRANDREAQRAIRERTKNQIETLERKIRDLTSQQPYQELQHVLRSKEQVEEENRDVRKRLHDVLGIITPVLNAHGEGPPAQQYIPNRPGSSSNLNILTPNSATSSSSAAMHWQAPNAPMGQDPRNNYPPIPNAQSQQLQKQRHDMAHNLDMGPERLGLDFLLDNTQRIPKVLNGINTSNASPQYQPQNPYQPSAHGSPESRHRSTSVSSTTHPSYASLPNLSPEVPYYAAPVRNGPPTCPLDSLLLDFLHERQQQAAEGVPSPKLVGPAYPSVSSLLNPALSLTSHPLSKVFTDILSTFPDLSSLPEKVAVLYIMFLIMRWQIHPTVENYDRLPDWVSPRPSQLFTKHPAWIDHLPWPKMRDTLVRDYDPKVYLFDNWFIPFTTTVSVNWGYEATDCLLKVDAAGNGGEDLVINPVFERHLRDLGNWSLGPAFARAFPGLEGTYRLKVDGEKR